MTMHYTTWEVHPAPERLAKLKKTSLINQQYADGENKSQVYNNPTSEIHRYTAERTQCNEGRKINDAPRNIYQPLSCDQDAFPRPESLSEIHDLR